MASDIPSAALNARAFQDACAYGDLEAAQSLAHDMTTDDARVFGNYALRHACINGHLATAQWLVGRFDLTAEDIRACDNEALRYVCANGHLKIVQWIVVKFGLTAADARAFNNYALLHACANGHLELAQWFTEQYDLTAADARAENYAMRDRSPSDRPVVIRPLRTDGGRHAFR